MRTGIGDYLRSRGAVWDDAPDDVLDAGTIWKIEQLQGAVLELEGERRFGRSPGRSGELEALQDEVQALLEAHGFTSYNDYRLRVRRSRAATTVDPRPAAPAVPPAPRAGAAPEPYLEADGPEPYLEADGPEPTADANNHPEGAPPPAREPAEGLVVLGQVPAGTATPSADAAVTRAEEFALALRREFDRQLTERVQRAQR
jgi:hypothetical protein